MLEYARTVHSQVVDNLESCDMELDTISDKEEILANKSTNPNTENVSINNIYLLLFKVINFKNNCLD